METMTRPFRFRASTEQLRQRVENVVMRQARARPGVSTRRVARNSPWGPSEEMSGPISRAGLHLSLCRSKLGEDDDSSQRQFFVSIAEAL